MEIAEAKVTCTGIELSPDKWEKVYIKFDILEPHNKHPYRKDIILPRITIRKVIDEKTGEEVEKKVNAFHNGYFTQHFENKAAAPAVETYYPGYVDDVKLFRKIRRAINSAAEAIRLDPMMMDKEVMELKDTLELYDSMSLDQEEVWRMYNQTLARIHAFGREGMDAATPEPKTNE